MKKKILLCMSWLLIALVAAMPEMASAKKKKKDGPSAPPKSAYEKLLDKPGKVSAKGDFVSLHKVNDKLYVEMPVKYFGRDVLISSTTIESGNSRLATVGYKQNDPMHVRFALLDSTVVMLSASTNMESDEELNLARERSYRDAIMQRYKIAAYNQDSTAVVFDMTALFTGDEKQLCPVASNFSVLKIRANLKKEFSSLAEIKAFSDNASIASYLTYDCSYTFMGSEVASNSLTTKVNRTLLLLPEQPMRPRIADSRLGTFLTSKQRLTLKKDGIDNYSYANHWRLEPKDTAAWLRGELVEPVKPIVWYVDDAFPEDWKEPLKQSVLIWNKAFEKIGFKNAMIAKDFPKDDPEFDPDNIKYSCIRYIPISVENAMGPSWVDPRSGEIISASVLVYNDVIKLINNWRFVQTSQLDKRVRAQKMPDDVVKESLSYVFSHEIGHTLGLMHNMGASHAYAVDSLRSASFTQQYGTTPSIMDYARFNYVAQPGDKGVRLTPPDLGVYDEYAIKYLYQPIPGNLSFEEESKVLESWVDAKAGDPLYRYGKQQVMSRYDPSALEEDLGDDPMKAGEYGIKNLQYILSHMNEWIKDDESSAHRQELYGTLCNQYARYISNVLANVGGIYLTEVKEGTTGERWTSVPGRLQHQSLLWVVDQLRKSDWLDAPELTRKFPMAVNKSLSLRSNIGRKLFDRNNPVLLSAHLSQQDAYTQKEYYEDLYTAIWQPTIQGKKLTAGDKLLQRIAVKDAVAGVGKSVSKKGGKSLTSAYAPSVDEIIAYRLDPTGFVAQHRDELLNVEEEQGNGTIAGCLFGSERMFGDQSDYGFQGEVGTDQLDESAAYQLMMAEKIERLLKSKIGSASADDKAHYQQLLLMITSAKN
jgi:hypothetical protein